MLALNEPPNCISGLKLGLLADVAVIGRMF